MLILEGASILILHTNADESGYTARKNARSVVPAKHGAAK